MECGIFPTSGGKVNIVMIVAHFDVLSCFAIGIIVSAGVGAIMRHYGATFPKYESTQTHSITLLF